MLHNLKIVFPNCKLITLVEIYSSDDDVKNLLHNHGLKTNNIGKKS